MLFLGYYIINRLDVCSKLYIDQSIVLMMSSFMVKFLCFLCAYVVKHVRLVSSHRAIPLSHIFDNKTLITPLLWNPIIGSGIWTVLCVCE